MLGVVICLGKLQLCPAYQFFIHRMIGNVLFACHVDRLLLSGPFTCTGTGIFKVSQGQPAGGFGCIDLQLKI
jgi:hypothetical protein